MGIGIVGAGRLAQAVSRRWSEADGPPGLIYSRTPARASSLALELGWTVAPSAAAVVLGSPLTLLAVPDSELSQLGLDLAQAVAVPAPASIRVVAHCAGIVGLAPLAPLRDAGCAVGVFHPLAAIPDGDPACLDQTFISIESDPRAQPPLLELAARLSCQPILADRLNRPLYHAAAVFSGVLPVLLERVAERLATAAGGADDLTQGLRALHLASARNVRRLGPQLGLSGPQERQDAGTVSAHLEALGRVDPALADLYASIQEAARPVPADRTG